MKGLFKRPESKLVKRGKVFGVPLLEVCSRENSPIPFIAEEAIDYIETNGLKVEGIFRIPGNSQFQDQLKAFYNGESNELPLSKCEDVHAVAGLLKLYLRELPDPLLTHRFYSTFVAVQKNPDPTYRMTNIRKLVNALPPCNKFLLTRLCGFLISIAKESEINKMNVMNLAIVFGPNLLRPKTDTVRRLIEDALYVNGVIRSLLDEFEFLVTCTAQQPHKQENQIVITPAPRLEISYVDSQNEKTQPSGASKRRAFKFNVSEISEQDTEKNGGGNTKLEESKKNNKNSTEQEGKTKSELENGESESVVEFDLENPLTFAMKALHELAVQSGRGFDIAQMSIPQLIDEKVHVKRQLRYFDNAFKAKHGSEPTKKDKEPLRQLYQRYRDLTKAIEEKQKRGENKESHATSTETSKKEPTQSKTGNLIEENEMIKLKNEKRQLQIYLHQYQANFIKQHGRRVQFVQDREPVQKEYDRYREIKTILQHCDKSQNKADSSVDKSDKTEISEKSEKIVSEITSKNGVRD